MTTRPTPEQLVEMKDALKGYDQHAMDINLAGARKAKHDGTIGYAVGGVLFFFVFLFNFIRLQNKSQKDANGWAAFLSLLGFTLAPGLMWGLAIPNLKKDLTNKEEDMDAYVRLNHTEIALQTRDAYPELFK